MYEAKLYRKLLKDAQENLVRWHRLCRQLHKALDPTWRRMLTNKQSDVILLKTLIKRAEEVSTAARKAMKSAA